MKKRREDADRLDGFYLNVKRCDAHVKVVLITPLFFKRSRGKRAAAAKRQHLRYHAD